VPVTERTIASTTQLLDLASGQWATDLIGQLGLPSRMFEHPVVPSATSLDFLRANQDVGPTGPVLLAASGTARRTPRVVTVAGHDTACAVAALPAPGPSIGYVVCGTWSLVGIELVSPITSAEARMAGFTNEAGLGGTFRFLRNGTGLWLLQACRRAWGESVSYADLIDQAAHASAFDALIDPDHSSFLPVGDMPARIVDFCVRSGHSPPVGRAAMVRCVIDSLALSYRRTVDLAESLAGRSVEALHLVGGGSANGLLCQTTAYVTGRVVLAGPDEASGIGNLLIQALAEGELSSLADLRSVVAASFPPVVYHPRLKMERVDELIDRFNRIAATE
jgi:rhamnulokinase